MVGKDQLIVINLPGGEAYNKRDGFVESLQHPSITGITRASHIPPDLLGVNNPYRVEGQDKEDWVPVVNVHYDYFSTLGLEIVAGRPFSRDFTTDADAAMIINEAAARHFNVKTPLGTRFVTDMGTRQRTVIGVVKDFYFEPLYHTIKPVVFRLNPMSTWRVIVRIRPDDIPGSLAFLERQWKTVFPGQFFHYEFVDQRVEQQYRAEEKTMQLMGYFTGLAIVIACLGLFGLAAYTVERRTKEIGIRKVLGASASHLTLLLSKEFVWLVIIANAIAWPVAYVAMGRWLEHFAYHIELGAGLFAWGGLMALMITLLTVSGQAFRAARMNPVKTLRYE
jgi:putative ABC transport system permease protein